MNFFLRHPVYIYIIIYFIYYIYIYYETRYMLSLPYSSGISYKERLMKTGLLPLCYWHEYLNLVYLFKKIVSADDPNIQIKAIRRAPGITVKLAKLP